MSNTAYESLINHIKEASLLGSTSSLLWWDQETMMPTGGGAVGFRANQIAQLSGMVHQMKTESRIADWLAACESDESLTSDATSVTAVNIRLMRRDYDRATKLPADLVAEVAQTTAQAKHHWAQARKDNDYATFKPWLEKIIELNRRKADCWGWASDGEPWDALAEGFEPGMTAAGVEKVFTPLRKKLVKLVAELMASKHAPSNRFNELKLAIDSQQKFVRDVIAKVGFDFNRGRLDTSTHPFCGGSHRDDIRMTTRFHENMLNDALGSTLHESGHGIYNQNLPDGEHLNTPFGSPAGLAVHESQSRMIENQLGRSRSFWVWCFPRLGNFFGEKVFDLSIDDCYGGANIVQPGLIRVEADEATYNLHIMIRFELERAIVKGDLSADDLPGVWNEKYKEYMDVEVPDDAQGCMQDIHWSMGAMGYFPTYTLGNLLAAQFFEKAQADMPDLDDQFERGEFSGLVRWLNKNIHQQGSRFLANDLCEHVTGKPLSADPLMRHLESKLRPLYEL